MFTERMHRIVQLLERVLIVLLLIMAALAIVEVGFELYATAFYVLMKGAGLAVLILAIGVTWYLLRRSSTTLVHPTE